MGRLRAGGAILGVKLVEKGAALPKDAEGPLERALEDADDVAVAEERLADAGPTIPWAEVKAKLGL